MEDQCIPRRECDACKEKYDEINYGQNKRLDALEESVKQIHALAIAVEKMTLSIEQMTKELTKQGERLAEIEKEPALKWKQASWLVIAGLIGAVLSYLVTHIGL